MTWLRSSADGEGAHFTAAIYGSLLVTTLVAVQWQADANPELIALTLLTSVAVFWLTYVWAGIVDGRTRGAIGRDEVRRLARAEAPMLVAALAPAAVLGAYRFTSISTDTLIGLALIVCIAQLFLWGLVVGRVAHDSWAVALGIATVDCLLGIVVVLAKVAVLH